MKVTYINSISNIDIYSICNFLALKPDVLQIIYTYIFRISALKYPKTAFAT